jgi:hypothetical protein
MLNPKLNIGDTVILLHMDGETSIPPGTKGLVKSHSRVFGDDQYTVKWENGSTLAIIGSVDLWDTEENRQNKKKRDIKERDEMDRSKTFIKNLDVFKFFNMKFLHEYLKKVRESGIVNMFGASPYLYLGKDRIEHEFKYQEVVNEEEFEEVLEMANLAQSEMIRGVMNVLDHEGKEHDLKLINRYLQRYATKVLENYMNLF